MPLPARSPPSRGRGSKHQEPHDLRRASRVAPLTGARIETGCAGHDVTTARRSPPSRGRGSKRLSPATADAGDRGRPPHGGADRNRRAARHARRGTAVAPLTGARIETMQSVACDDAADRSPPSRGRGSKPIIAMPCVGIGSQRRPPHGGADRNLEPERRRLDAARWSPPSRGRGSKRRLPRAGRRDRLWSPPSRGRGSKRSLTPIAPRALRVAPLTGARIETLGSTQIACVEPTRSPPSRGRGSKRHTGRAVRAAAVAPLTGARIETAQPLDRGAAMVAPLTGARIETAGCVELQSPSRGRGSKHVGRRVAVAPLTGARIETRVRSLVDERGIDGSPPSRGRGSKRSPHGRAIDALAAMVAPLTGARIETGLRSRQSS